MVHVTIIRSCVPRSGTIKREVLWLSTQKRIVAKVKSHARATTELKV